MTVGSLFSGIGGIDLGLERAGHSILWQVENNPKCRKVLAKHWPEIPCYHDITKLTAEDLEPVDLLCGGFPCQPVSVAGKQKGEDDERWLWPEFLRLARSLRVQHLLVENVTGLLAAHGGETFASLLSGLAEAGYDAEWDCLPASAFKAPHRRDRVFLIAHRQPRRDDPLADSQEFTERSRLCKSDPTEERRRRSRNSRRKDMADSHSFRREEQRWPISARAEFRSPQRGGDSSSNSDHEKQLRLSVYDDARTSLEEFTRSIGWFESECGLGRVASRIPGRVDRLRGLGNAVVPFVAEWIGLRLAGSDTFRTSAPDRALPE
jgi:DNA (cytosine-5)-methyltransferase 1